MPLSVSLAEDTGISASDRITKNEVIKISGTDRSTAYWEYTTDSGKNWKRGLGDSFTVKDGTYSDGQVSVRQTDIAGNVSPVQGLKNFFIDKEPPFAVDLSLADDTGSINSDWLTSNGILNVNGRDAILNISRDSGLSWITVPVITSGLGQLLLPPGIYPKGQIIIRHTDLAGNITVQSNQQRIEVVNDWEDITGIEYTQNVDSTPFLKKTTELTQRFDRDNLTKFTKVRDVKGPISFTTDPDSVTSNRSGLIGNGKKVYLFVHGWNRSAYAHDSIDLFKKMRSSVDASTHIVFVDWQDLARSLHKDDVIPFSEASVTAQVGHCVADALIRAGVDPVNITLIGHSLGSFVVAATSRSLLERTGKKPYELIALDTPYSPSGYQLDARGEGGDTSAALDFGSLAVNSSSYTVADSHGLHAISGDNPRAASAKSAFLVRYLSPNQGDGFEIPGVATAYHNGIIGVYGDLFQKDILTPAKVMVDPPNDAWDKDGYEKNGPFDGVILAPRNWVDNPNGDIYDGKGNVMSANAFGWQRKHTIFASNKDDIIFIDKLRSELTYAEHPWIHALDGNDVIIADKGIRDVSLGHGNDTIYFGYKRYGNNEIALDDASPLSWGGKQEFLVIRDYKQGAEANGEYDRLMFNQKQADIGYKPAQDFDEGLVRRYGPGTVIYKKGWWGWGGDDLLAYVVGVQTKDIEWGINNGRINFDEPFFDLDSNNRMHNYHWHGARAPKI